MQTFKAAVLVTGLLALGGCSDLGPYFVHQKDVCIDRWYGYWQPPCPPVAVAEVMSSSASAAGELDAVKRDNDRLRKQLDDRDRQLAAANQRNADLERQLAAAKASADELEAARRDINGLRKQLDDRDRQLAAANQRIDDLERQLAAAKAAQPAVSPVAKLETAKQGLIRALRPQIEKGDITLDLNSERLLIKLASSYLFGSGQAELKPGGSQALKKVGEILKDYPEYKVAVEGHTDNQRLRSTLKKKFATNQELSEARAANAAKALEEGGLSGAATAGFADTKPVASNGTEAGRAQNRRVEILVTK